MATKKTPRKPAKKDPRGRKPRREKPALARLVIRLTEDELERIQRAASAELTPCAAWARRVLLAAAEEAVITS